MGRLVTISDDLAARLEARRQRTGETSLDAAAEALIAEGLVLDQSDGDHSAGYTDEELRALIAEAETGVTAPWSADDIKDVRRRYANSSRRDG